MVNIATPDEMFELGRRIGAQLHPGDLLILNGPLGAGKTLLTQGIGASLGITGITSPTFVISRVHKGEIPFIHVDAYRLMISENPTFSFDDLDLDTERESAITVVEWGGDLASRLSDERLEINIDRSSDIRIVTAKGYGARWEGFSL
ncbi:MAG: tRNA (adenosine(37)-N6)-threonylcarbamoyltransferase complex ATPase subunit type 1 TsaE [Candidatus Nanopelagicaceae bacterium]|nr:tRNA (adenosine(37)-N6)-threonylcarbamoyltransferase complex ATPase subunit type 1 TsaE [Candidatus Nanopelagicaceae bacterium]